MRIDYQNNIYDTYTWNYIDERRNLTDMSIKAEEKNTDSVMDANNKLTHFFESQDGVVIKKAAQVMALTNQQYQSRLSSLGFYSGPIDGVLTSDISKKAIKNFQRVYGLTENGTLSSSTINKLNAVYTKYQNVYSSSGFLNVSNAFQLDSSEKMNFARTYAFLRVGMGLTSEQTAGVMGNIFAESRFAPDNAYNGSYPGDHNSSYTYSTTDNIAYGLIQWKYSNRKQGLLTEANNMGLSYSDINAQFSYFKVEMNGAFSTPWNQIKNTNSVHTAADIFLDSIEISNSSSTVREGYADTIYNNLSTY